MHYTIQLSRLGKLIRQRNNAALIIGGLLLACSIEAFTIVHLADHQQQRFIPLPPVISAPFSISRQTISPSYLADMTRYFALLRLNYTPATITNQAATLLRYTDSRDYATLKAQLSHEIQTTQRNAMALSFAPVDTRVDAKTLTVFITGDLRTYVGKTRLPVKRVTYRVRYRYRNGQLRVTSMTEETGGKQHD